jgi:peptide/nickel transport system permease protein
MYCLRKLIYGIPLILGVTLISFVLMVYFGPDLTYELLGKNPTPEQIAEVRASLGYDQPFVVRYGQYLWELVTFDFGASQSTGELVSDILLRTAPVSLMVEVPGFVLGNLLAVALAMLAAAYRGQWIDKAVMIFSVVGMSISVLIVIIVFQIVFCSSYGLDWFPVQGWDIQNFGDYLRYVTVPTMATIFVALGYNTRFYRAVLVEELNKDHVRTAKAFGAHPMEIMLCDVLRHSMIPIVTRIILSLPYLLIGGSLLIESFFSIPGIGLVTRDAITSGDQPILKAIVSLTAILYVILLTLTDVVYQWIDPRIKLA